MSVQVPNAVEVSDSRRCELEQFSAPASEMTIHGNDFQNQIFVETQGKVFAPSESRRENPRLGGNFPRARDERKKTKAER